MTAAIALKGPVLDVENYRNMIHDPSRMQRRGPSAFLFFRAQDSNQYTGGDYVRHQAGTPLYPRLPAQPQGSGSTSVAGAESATHDLNASRLATSRETNRPNTLPFIYPPTLDGTGPGPKDGKGKGGLRAACTNAHNMDA